MNSIYFALALLLLLAQLAMSQNPVWRPGAPDIVVSRLSTTVTISGNLAQSLVEIHFSNPSSRQGEGELTFPLPNGVSVSRYSLDINGEFREAVPVPKDKGTQVFEALENVRVDPGLLTKDANSNSFHTRVFPIPAGGSRKILIGYQEELIMNGQGLLNYHLFSSYGSKVASYSLKVTIEGDEKNKPQVKEDGKDATIKFESAGCIYSYSATEYQPSKDLSITLPNKGSSIGLLTSPDVEDSHFFYTYLDARDLASISTPITTAKTRKTIGIIWDTSLSSLKRNFDKQWQVLDAYFAANPIAEVRLYLLGYYFLEAQRQNISGGDWGQIKSYLQSQVRYDGGTKYSTVRLATPVDEMLLFSDGVVTLGRASELQLQAGTVLHAINSNPTASHDVLSALVQKYNGVYVDLMILSASDAASALASPPIRFFGIEINSNITEVYPLNGTPVLGKVFSIVGRASSLPQTIVARFGVSAESITKKINITLVKTERAGVDVSRLWAQKAIAALEQNYDDNKDQVNALGGRYSLVTKGSSLIVLESVSDYVKYDILPPASLRAEYDRIAKQSQDAMLARRTSGFQTVNAYWNDLNSWWSNPKIVVPNNNRRPPIEPPLLNQRIAANTRIQIPAGMPAVPPISEPATPQHAIANTISPTPSQPSQMLRTVAVNDTGADPAWQLPVGMASTQDISVTNTMVVTRLLNTTNLRSDSNNQIQRNLTLVAKKPNEFNTNRSYIDTIQSAAGEQAQYNAYLEQRNTNLLNPTFYIDCAEILYVTNRTLALQVLSSIADLSLENAFIYKSLFYYFRQYEAYSDCLFAAQKVNEWRSFEPQSHRDLALAHELNNNFQEAAKELSRTLNTTFFTEVNGRVDGLQDVVLMDIGRMVSEHGKDIFKGVIQDKYLTPLPVDLRVIMNWNQINVDLDLHVSDPFGEQCYYGHRSTAIGGRYSKDFTTGLGPEQFLLKKAPAGNYRIWSNYYGERKLTDSGPTTVNVEIYQKDAASGKLKVQYRTMQVSKVKGNGSLAELTL